MYGLHSSDMELLLLQTIGKALNEVGLMAPASWKLRPVLEPELEGPGPRRGANSIMA